MQTVNCDNNKNHAVTSSIPEGVIQSALSLRSDVLLMALVKIHCLVARIGDHEKRNSITLRCCLLHKVTSMPPKTHVSAQLEHIGYYKRFQRGLRAPFFCLKYLY